jgi:uncharacterized protein (TIGR02145 family)
MKKILLLISFFVPFNTYSQSYLISFAGTGESTIVNTVIAENLTKGSSVTLNGSDILRLNVITGLRQETREVSGNLIIYPNPSANKSRIEVFPPVSGNAIISVTELTGRVIAQVQMNLEVSRQEFTLTGLNKGVYLISVKGSKYAFCGKIISTINQGNNAKIEREPVSTDQVYQSKVGNTGKGTEVFVDMDYSSGDLIKFTGISGNYSTVMVDNPTLDKTISFNFVLCEDGDNNYYPVVEIGTQTWMAANLKTTKYSDGTIIPFINTTNGWDILIETDKAFCYLLDNISNANIYGALYTWTAAMNGAASTNSNPSGVQGVCPTGWHLPSVDEWSTLVNFLGGSTLAGGKLKETSTSHWNPNTGATNESGFTAIPGGFREDWAWQGINIIGGWWSSTENNLNNGWSRWADASSISVTSYSSNKKYGFSVRCLKN